VASHAEPRADRLAVISMMPRAARQEHGDSVAPVHGISRHNSKRLEAETRVNEAGQRPERVSRPTASGTMDPQHPGWRGQSGLTRR
jgi:hypothetical protein